MNVRIYSDIFKILKISYNEVCAYLPKAINRLKELLIKKRKHIFNDGYLTLDSYYLYHDFPNHFTAFKMYLIVFSYLLSKQKILLINSERKEILIYILDYEGALIELTNLKNSLYKRHFVSILEECLPVVKNVAKILKVSKGKDLNVFEIKTYLEDSSEYILHL